MVSQYMEGERGRHTLLRLPGGDRPYTDLDSYNADTDAVVMMTLHSAKGLEFPNVFIVGMEEGSSCGLCHATTRRSGGGAALCHVGITRAALPVNSSQRLIFGQTARNRPSRFLKEVPQELCDVHDQTLLARKLTGSNKVAPKRPSTPKTTSAWPPSTPGTTIALSPGDRVSTKVFGEG